MAELPDDRKTVRPLRKRIKELTAGSLKTLNEARSENEPATIHINGLAELAEDLEKLSANLDHEIGSEKAARLRGVLLLLCAHPVRRMSLTANSTSP